jgi:hypothetical protein
METSEEIQIQILHSHANYRAAIVWRSAIIFLRAAQHKERKYPVLGLK